MNPKFLKRLNRLGPPQYPQGPGLACFMCGDFAEIKALIFEAGYGEQLDAYIASAKEIAKAEPSDHEMSTFCPLSIRDLPPNPYRAHVAIGSQVLFINNRTDVDGFLVLCLPIPTMELNAIALCANLAIDFMGSYSHGKFGWADTEPIRPEKN